MLCENLTCRSTEIINFLYTSVCIVAFLLEKAYIFKSRIGGISILHDKSWDLSVTINRSLYGKFVQKTCIEKPVKSYEKSVTNRTM